MQNIKSQSRMNATYILLTPAVFIGMSLDHIGTSGNRMGMTATATTQASALRDVVIRNVVTMVMLR